jgi:hypothetical protein
MFSIAVHLLRLLPDPIQHSDATAQLGGRDIVEQFVAELECRRADLRDNALSAPRQMDRLATAIVRRIFSRYPAIAFQAMQQRHQRWFFDAEMSGNFGLGQRTRRDRQVHKGAPFRLTQTHRFEALIQLQPPGAGSAVQKRTEYIDIPVQSKLVSMLTNSNSEQCQCHRPSRS